MQLIPLIAIAALVVAGCVGTPPKDDGRGPFFGAGRAGVNVSK
ncbi:MAG: hypothetical protein AAGA26_09115 [Pseudomonadota bacterium]